MQVQAFDIKGIDRKTSDLARDIISSCVHCGMCNATCPTYQLLGDEQDGPRGRIYLIKQMLEDGDASNITRNHLDRCLTCQNCETTCPSGVQYSHLLDIGRRVAQQQAPYPLNQRALRQGLLWLLPKPKRILPLLRAGQYSRRLLPAALRQQIPKLQRLKKLNLPSDQHPESILLHEGCVQSVATPVTNHCARQIFDKLAVSIQSTGAVCCGAIHWHLHAEEQARTVIKDNIDAWHQALSSGAQQIISTASGCGNFIKSYQRIMADDPDYASKAELVSSKCQDIAVHLHSNGLHKKLKPSQFKGEIAVHTPCTLQHGQKSPSALTTILRDLGFKLQPTANPHSCCGSAGTYSILQKDIARQLRKRKLADLCVNKPKQIVTANIGCQIHLDNAKVPVRHWLELVSEHCL